ncbi:MAG: hypothetical protein QNJ68_12785 [Microcoleaceae cyanobacterium MO_207.B10]|nr:hypothetical protein [Microcoleaceae cyanobacterium MO_207.B10]
MARFRSHPTLPEATQLCVSKTTAFYPLKMGGAYPEFFGKNTRLIS